MNQQIKRSEGGSDYQSKTKSKEEGNEALMSRFQKPGLTRQVTERWQFTQLEKMTALRNIQRNIEVRLLRIQSACRVANLHHKQFITRKRDIIQKLAKRNMKAKSMCIGTSSILHPFEEP